MSRPVQRRICMRHRSFRNEHKKVGFHRTVDVLERSVSRVAQNQLTDFCFPLMTRGEGRLDLKPLQR